MIRTYTDEAASPATRSDLEVEISGALLDFFADDAADDCESANAGSSHVA